MVNYNQLNDEFEWIMKDFEDDDNNDDNEVGITGVIDIENDNSFEVTRIKVLFRQYQTRKLIMDQVTFICII